MASVQGLPPLPRSLSGFSLSEGCSKVDEAPPPPTRSSSRTRNNIKSFQLTSTPPSLPSRQLTTLDTQLVTLRKEMESVRDLAIILKCYGETTAKDRYVYYNAAASRV